MSYSLLVTNLSSFCVSFIKSGFAFLLGFTTSLSLSNLGVSIFADAEFLYRFAENAKNWMPSKKRKNSFWNLNLGPDY